MPASRATSIQNSGAHYWLAVFSTLQIGGSRVGFQVWIDTDRLGFTKIDSPYIDPHYGGPGQKYNRVPLRGQWFADALTNSEEAQTTSLAS
jgi:hypothetical protein